MRSVVLKRFAAGFALMCAGGLAIATSSSCVLIDAPPDLPTSPVRRPTILRSEVVPSALTPLGVLPINGQFSVPIEIADPTQSVTWVAFLDYGQESEFQIGSDTLYGSSTAADIQTVTFNVPAQRVQGAECHTILFLVALSTAFNGSPHDSDPNLSDTVVWYFAPGGNAGACTTYDGGGNDGAFPNVDANLADADDGSAE